MQKSVTSTQHVGWIKIEFDNKTLFPSFDTQNQKPFDKLPDDVLTAIKVITKYVNSEWELEDEEGTLLEDVAVEKIVDDLAKPVVEAEPVAVEK